MKVYCLDGGCRWPYQANVTGPILLFFSSFFFSMVLFSRIGVFYLFCCRLHFTWIELNPDSYRDSTQSHYDGLMYFRLRSRLSELTILLRLDHNCTSPASYPRTKVSKSPGTRRSYGIKFLLPPRSSRSTWVASSIDWSRRTTSGKADEWTWA